MLYGMFPCLIKKITQLAGFGLQVLNYRLVPQLHWW
jgi:hypothetical protein